MVRTIILKEWDEARSNSMIVLTAIIPAAVFALLPALMVWLMRAKAGDVGPLSTEFIDAMFGQFLMFFVVLPVIIPSTMASHSIIGEKQNRTLEPLLATPVKTSELLLAKSLASVIPSVLVTWIAYAVNIAAVYIIGGPRFIPVIWRPEAIATLVLVAPAMAAIGLLLIVLFSSRSSDPREAQQWSVFLIMPSMGLGIGVAMGKIAATVPLLAAIAAGLAVVDVIMLRFVTAMFRREQILTLWK
jgi:ABC-2 type transport system permease protein